VSFRVRLSPSAENDLVQLADFLIDKAKTASDLALTQAAIDAIQRAAFSQLAATPYSFRKTGRSQTRRELIIPFGVTGYVALYEIDSAASVVVLAVRHQREQDYH
jgi:plasmid stabilization system protein ParE